jgi:hypothetical protein
MTQPPQPRAKLATAKAEDPETVFPIDVTLTRPKPNQREHTLVKPKDKGTKIKL